MASKIVICINIFLIAFFLSYYIYERESRFRWPEIVPGVFFYEIATGLVLVLVVLYPGVAESDCRFEIQAFTEYPLVAV